MLPQMPNHERRRSQRVMVQIPVRIQMSMGDGRLLRNDAFTLAVNAHGGLLDMETKPETGQRMLLMNPQSGLEQSARVVGAKRSREGGFAVAFEFDTPTPKLWALSLAPDDWKLEPR